MALNLRKRVVEFLQENKEKLYTAREIAEWIFENFPEECAEKKAASTAGYLNTDADLIQQLVAEIGGSRPRWQKQHSELKTTEGRPRKFYWTDKNAGQEIEAAESESVSVNEIKSGLSVLKEHDLYPLLTEYLLSQHSIYSCRIDEKKSSNKAGNGGNEWLHPDLVGMEDLSRDWTRDLKDCVGVLAERRAKLWSFEVKLQINRSNVRKAYFQTVSNSSWAHYGYLVAEKIGDDAIKELRMLAATHGIGVIELDANVPSESSILIPAKERAEIDWDMCNRLSEENKDFVDYLTRVKHFHQTGKTKESDWN